MISYVLQEIRPSRKQLDHFWKFVPVLTKAYANSDQENFIQKALDYRL